MSLSEAEIKNLKCQVDMLWDCYYSLEESNKVCAFRLSPLLEELMKSHNAQRLYKPLLDKYIYTSIKKEDEEAKE